MKLPAFIRSARSEASSKGLFDFSLVVLGLVILALVLMICLSGLMTKDIGSGVAPKTAPFASPLAVARSSDYGRTSAPLTNALSHNPSQR